MAGKKQKDERSMAPTEEKVDLSTWQPRTSLGKKVQSKEITDIEAILDEGSAILESQITDALVSGLENDLVMIGQSKGKFGGGARRVFKQTQKKTSEGNKPSFATIAIVGNKNGLVGIGYGKSKETVPAREKAVRNAKRNVFKIMRGCGSWQCNCKTPHSIPFKVYGKCGSAEITLMPAPKGKGLVVEKEVAKMLRLAGVKDCWSTTKGQSREKQNLMVAAENALRQLIKVKLQPRFNEQLGIAEGMIKQ